MKGTGTIQIELTGLSPEELDRCKEIIDTLFIKRVMAIKNGKALLHFDGDGRLRKIEYTSEWTKDKPEQSPQMLYTAKTEVIDARIPG